MKKKIYVSLLFAELLSLCSIFSLLFKYEVRSFCLDDIFLEMNGSELELNTFGIKYEK